MCGGNTFSWAAEIPPGSIIHAGSYVASHPPPLSPPPSPFPHSPPLHSAIPPMTVRYDGSIFVVATSKLQYRFLH